jgi:tryptophanyl-tRNA synthetase
MGVRCKHKKGTSYDTTSRKYIRHIQERKLTFPHPGLVPVGSDCDKHLRLVLEDTHLYTFSL